MNIFAVDNDPVYCAYYLDIKRANKMLIESCQMMSTAINILGNNGPYKSTHQNHPCSIWVRSSSQNYLWLWAHAAALSERYKLRTGREHKSSSHLKYLLSQAYTMPKRPFQPFKNCTKNYKHIDDTNQAYRYHLYDKFISDKRKPTWEENNKIAKICLLSQTFSV